jgi:hypothetical protein
MSENTRDFEAFAEEEGLAPEKPELILPGASTPYTETAKAMFPVLAKRRRYFVRGQLIVEIALQKILGDKQAHDIFQVLEADSLRSRIEKYFSLFAWRQQGGQPVLKPARCNHDAAAVLLKTDEAFGLLPTIRTLAPCPVLVGEPRKLEILYKGYHERNGGLYVLNGEKKIVVPPLKEAVEIILEILYDYEFATENDRSRAVATFVSPALRAGGLLGEIDFPLDIAEANASQSGKTFRQKLVCATYGVVPYLISKRTGGVGSLDESLSTALISGIPFILIDNFRGRLDSQILETCLRGAGTAPARVPYRGEVQIPTTYLNWMLSSNGLEGTPDIGNRSMVTRICKRPPGYRFRQYPEGNILAHIRTNPERILGAVFAIVIAWDKAGRERTAEIRHEFIEACQSLDWVVQEVFHLPPLLEGHTQEILRMSDPALSWLRLVAIAVENKDRWEEAFSASEIADLCQSKGIELPGSTRITNDEQLSMHTGRLLGRLFADDTPVEIDRYKITRQTRQEYGANHKGIISKHYYFFQKRK